LRAEEGGERHGPREEPRVSAALLDAAEAPEIVPSLMRRTDTMKTHERHRNLVLVGIVGVLLALGAAWT
jgi:hypothetical protein